MTTDNQPNLPTPEQWAPVVETLKEATRDYWIQQMDQDLDYMLDDTTHHLANIVRMHFPELDAVCRADAREYISNVMEANHGT